MLGIVFEHSQFCTFLFNCKKTFSLKGAKPDIMREQSIALDWCCDNAEQLIHMWSVINAVYCFCDMTIL